MWTRLRKLFDLLEARARRDNSAPRAESHIQLWSPNWSWRPAEMPVLEQEPIELQLPEPEDVEQNVTFS